MFIGLSAILYIISIAMVVIGVEVTANGSQIFPSDRAIAEYISGISLITGGAIVFGLATLILCLGRLNKTLKERQGSTTFADNAGQPASSFASSASLDQRTFSDVAAEGSSSEFSAFSEPKDQAEFPAFAESHPRGDVAGKETIPPIGRPSSAKWAGINVGYIPSQPEPPKPAPSFTPARSSALSSDTDLLSGTGVPVRESAFGFFSYSAETTLEEPKQTDISVEAEALDVQAQNEPIQEEIIQETVAVVLPVPEMVTEEVAVQSVDQEQPVDAPAPEALVAHQPEERVEVPAEEASEPSSPQAPISEKPAVSVVGSYDSGGNRYVMYSDGSIEAHLPTGIRVFKSLDELKRSITGQ